MREMLQRVVRRVGDRGVGDVIQRKTSAGISDAAGDSATRPEIRYFDVLIGIEAPPVLDCVQQHFTERDGDSLSLFVRQIAADLLEKSQQPVGRLDIAAREKMNPGWLCG